MFSSYNDLVIQFADFLHSAILEFNTSGVPAFQQIAITQRQCNDIACGIMDAMEDSCVPGQLNTFPIYTSWFPYDFDFEEMVSDGFYRGNSGWIIEDCPGIVEDFILPKMFDEEFLIED
jgi:hypothetical protein